MGVLQKIIVLLVAILALSTTAYATQEQLEILLEEYINQEVTFNPLIGTGSGLWDDADENQTSYNITGFLSVINNNPNGRTISDIYVSLTNTTNLTAIPVYFAGRNGTWIEDNYSNNTIVLHVPELRTGENATFTYTINSTLIRPPLNLTSNYSATKALAGDNISITDVVHNVYDNLTSDTCIYDINISQIQSPVDFSGTLYNFTFYPGTLFGTDPNVTFDNSTNQTMYWYVRDGGCLNKDDIENINYVYGTPTNIPATTSYPIINTTLSYQLNNSASNMKVVDLFAISEANLTFDKRIVGPSDPLLFGSNVTWNVTGYFTTDTNISYNLTRVSFWVSQRNVNGSYTDPNTIDNDTIATSTPLNITYNPLVIANSTQPFTTNSWLFNYSDIPSPIVWMETNFSIANDGTQLVNRTITRNGNDLYIKELYLIIGYFLEIEKNITSIGEDTYGIRVDVRNRGNQVTPADTVVTIYDFIPNTYTLNGTFNYGVSTWYNTSEANSTVTGEYNGTLYQFALIPNNPLNTSFDAGPGINANTTWSVDYNVTGSGDYEVLDIFITGLDPQLVDGAGSSQGVVVSQVIDRLQSTEGIFAISAAVLLLLGLLV